MFLNSAIIIFSLLLLFACKKINESSYDMSQDAITKDSLYMRKWEEEYVDIEGENFTAWDMTKSPKEGIFELYKLKGKIVVIFPIYGRISECELIEQLYNEYGKNENDVLIYPYLSKFNIIKEEPPISWFVINDFTFPVLDIYLDIGEDISELYTLEKYRIGPSTLIFDEDSNVRVAYEYPPNHELFKRAIEYVRQNFSN